MQLIFSQKPLSWSFLLKKPIPPSLAFHLQKVMKQIMVSVDWQNFCLSSVVIAIYVYYYWMHCNIVRTFLPNFPSGGTSVSKWQRESILSCSNFFIGANGRNLDRPILQSMVRICSKTLRVKNWFLLAKNLWAGFNHWFFNVWDVQPRWQDIGPDF